jgi:hypothetical protein
MGDLRIRLRSLNIFLSSLIFALYRVSLFYVGGHNRERDEISIICNDLE